MKDRTHELMLFRQVRMGFGRVDEFGLESCGFLLSVGQGLTPLLSQSRLHRNVVS